VTTLRVGVVGARGVGAAHVAALRTLTGVDVAAVAGETKDGGVRAARALGVSRAAPSWQELVVDDTIDVLHVCTPNDTHAEITCAAIEAGKHVVCEKPLASKPSAARAMTDCAAGSAVTTALSYHYRYLPLVERLRRLVAEGALGGVHSVRGHYLQNWMCGEPPRGWRTAHGRVGDSAVLSDIGTHLIDLTEYITGQRFDRAVGDHAVPTRGSRANAHTRADLMLGLSGGAVAVLSLSQVSPGHTNSLALALDTGRASATWSYDGTERLEVVDRDQVPEVRVDDHVHAGGAGRFWVRTDGPGTSLRRFLNRTYRELRDDRRASDVPLPTFADGLRHLQLIADAVTDQRP